MSSDERIGGVGALTSPNALHLVPVEAITEETSNAITLGVDEETVWGAPRVSKPLAAPTDEQQRVLYEHYGYPYTTS